MPLYLQELGYTNIYRGDGTRSLARCTIKEFTGVTNLLLYVPHYHPHSWYAHKVENKWRLLIRDDRMLDFFRSLLEHKNLKEIIASIVLDNDEVKDALQSIVNTSEAAGGIVVSQKVNFIRQRPWGLKGIGKCWKWCIEMSVSPAKKTRLPRRWASKCSHSKTRTMPQPGTSQQCIPFRVRKSPTSSSAVAKRGLLTLSISWKAKSDKTLKEKNPQNPSRQKSHKIQK